MSRIDKMQKIIW